MQLVSVWVAGRKSSEDLLPCYSGAWRASQESGRGRGREEGSSHARGRGRKGRPGSCPLGSLEVSRDGERYGGHSVNATFTEGSTTQQKNVDIHDPSNALVHPILTNNNPYEDPDPPQSMRMLIGSSPHPMT